MLCPFTNFQESCKKSDCVLYHRIAKDCAFMVMVEGQSELKELLDKLLKQAERFR